MKFMIRARGPYALFTRPEFSAERLSYEAPPHSQARGLIEAVYWKPEMFYTIDKVELLKPVRWLSLYRNEVKDFGNGKAYRINDNMTQRMSTVLADVDYVIHATVHVSKKGMSDGEKVIKHFKIITERARKGQHFRHPSFGVREYQADVSLLEKRSDAPKAFQVDIDMGIMHFDRKGYCTGDLEEKVNLFYQCSVVDGILTYPTYETVATKGIILGRAA
jgi:CRISPR-associated protein Cas5d